jgi:hypothetical protein
MIFPILISIALSLSSCDSKPKGKAQACKPEVQDLVMPQILALQNIEEAKNKHLLNHPWLIQQPQITRLSKVIIDDLNSISTAHTQLSKQLVLANKNSPSLEETTSKITQHALMIQNQLTGMGFNFPKNYYHILNLPDSERLQVATPRPFQVHKRIHLCDNAMGIPVFLDLRVFDLGKSLPPEKQHIEILKIVDWHTKLLDNGYDDFRKLASKDRLVLLGRGNRNTEHFDNSHNMLSKDRGVFLAFSAKDNFLYVLHADAPWETLSPFESTFLNITNRKLKTWNFTIFDYPFFSSQLLSSN